MGSKSVSCGALRVTGPTGWTLSGFPQLPQLPMQKRLIDTSAKKGIRRARGNSIHLTDTA